MLLPRKLAVLCSLPLVSGNYSCHSALWSSGGKALLLPSFRLFPSRFSTLCPYLCKVHGPFKNNCCSTHHPGITLFSVYSLSFLLEPGLIQSGERSIPETEKQLLRVGSYRKVGCEWGKSRVPARWCCQLCLELNLQNPT